MVIAAVESAEEGGNIANLMFSLILIFCGVLSTPTALPGFWIFMYYVSPFTYLVSAMLSVGVANTQTTCLDYEYLKFDPPAGQNCGQYMANYIKLAGGYLENSDATTSCSFCQISNTNTFLAAINSYYSDRWRNFGIIWAYIVFNVGMALFLYWLVRVPKKSKTTQEIPPVGGGKEVDDGKGLGGPESLSRSNSGANGTGEVDKDVEKGGDGYKEYGEKHMETGAEVPKKL
jgi:ATP-binding cassette, subfamily G (WHITE), member 2, PDR